MVKSRIQIKQISNVAAGATVIISAPVGPRYHSFTLGLGNTADATVNAPATVGAIAGEIRLRLNNSIQRRVTADRLDAINTAMAAQHASQAFAGAVAGAGRRFLTIFLGEPWRKRLADQDALAWQTRHLGSDGVIEIEVDLKTGITPALTCFALVDDFSIGKPHLIMKWNTFDFQSTGTPLEYQFPRRPLEALAQVTIGDPTGGQTIDRARLVIEGREFHDLSKNENTTFNKNVADMNPAAGYYHLVLDHDDRTDDLLPMDYADAQLTLTPSASATGTLAMVVQSLGLPNT